MRVFNIIQTLIVERRNRLRDPVVDVVGVLIKIKGDPTPIKGFAKIDPVHEAVILYDDEDKTGFNVYLDPNEIAGISPVPEMENA